MTHAAMISGKYETFLANDLHGFGLRLFRDAIAGKCNGRWREWVSRDEFYEKRDKDPLECDMEQRQNRAFQENKRRQVSQAY